MLVPFGLMLVGALALDQEYGPLLMSAIVLALASYAVTAVPLSIMVAAALGWEVAWRVLHEAVDGRLLWPIPIVMLLLIPGRALRILVQRAHRERAAGVARDRVARAREEALLEENRKRRFVVSRELHDVVAHELTRIAMQSSVGQISHDPQEHRAALEAISASSRTAMTEMRRLVRLLNSGADESALATPGEGVGSLELVAELESAARYLADLGFRPEWRLEGDVEHIPAGLLPTSVTILREAATNIVKHGSPGVPCQLTATLGERVVTVEVDNELSSSLLDFPESGVGLAGLRARVAELGGTLTFGPENGWWTVKAVMPLIEPRAASEGTR